MASYFEMAEGRMVHDKLRAAGGFVWDHRREGSQTISVHMNRGYAMTPELRAELKKHGKALKAILEDDPGFYYEGRFWVDEWKSDKYYSTITINYNVYPFKMDLLSTMDPWLWDTVNFETGIIQETKDMLVNGTRTAIIYASGVRSLPEITADSEMTVKFRDRNYTLPSGKTTRLPQHYLEGENTFVFTGNGKVSINYRGGML